MKKIITVGAVAAVLLLASCSTTKPLYTWYDYTDDTYQSIKKADKKSQEELLKTYEKIVSKQEDDSRGIPPGVCADYGYMLIAAGKTKEGKELLMKEKALYPESAKFIDRILQRVK